MANTPTDADEGVLLGEFKKNSRETVRVRRTTYRGVPLVDVRAWYLDGDTLKPGKGLSLRLEQLPELRKTLQAAERQVKAEAKGAGAGGDDPAEDE